MQWRLFDRWGSISRFLSGSSRFCLEEGSNFVQNSRQNMTFRLRRIAFFHFTLPATGLALPFASLQVDIKKIGKLYDKSFFDIINNVFKPIMVIQLCQRKKM
jgi:hypothetical protein